MMISEQVEIQGNRFVSRSLPTRVSKLIPAEDWDVLLLKVEHAMELERTFRSGSNGIFTCLFVSVVVAFVTLWTLPDDERRVEEARMEEQNEVTHFCCAAVHK